MFWFVTIVRFIMEALPTDTLEKIESVASRYDVIGIDEGQFFPDLVEFSERMANVGKVVIVACLDGTFQRKVFRLITRLFCSSLIFGVVVLESPAFRPCARARPLS